MLHDVRNDTDRRAFCGPTVIASITGKPVSEVKALVRRITGKRSVTGMYEQHLIKALRCFGLRVIEQRRLQHMPTTERPTFAEWLREPWPKSIYVLVFSNHYVAVYGDYFVDSWTKGQVTPIADMKKWRRARIQTVIEVRRDDKPLYIYKARA